MDITAATISLKQAAAASGFSARWLRDALARGDLTLLGQVARQAGGWNKGAPVDVYRLLVLRKLLECGFSLDEAVYVLDCGVDPHLGGLCGCGIDLPVSFLLDRLHGHIMHVTRDDDADGLDVWSSPYGTPPDPDMGVTISFDLGNLAADAMRRLEVAHASTAAMLLGRSRGLGGSRGGVPAISTTTAADAANPGSNA